MFLVTKLYISRQRFAEMLAICFAASLTTAQTASSPAPTQDAVAVDAIGGIVITVSDLDRSVAFFTDVLTFTRAGESTQSGPALAALQDIPPKSTARTARLTLGEEAIQLVQYTPAGKPLPPDSRSNDRWFQHIAIVVRDMDRAYAMLMQHNVTAASRGGPQRLPDWNKNAAGIRAFYFRDPDDHYLELIQFPPGKGNPRWQSAQGDKLFLGIDHTAIVVSDTDASLKFYRDALGLKVVGGSENYGAEQEALNNVPGAHLRITTLRAPLGPAIEFLEYLQPSDGRPCPKDAQSNDIMRWQTTVVTTDVESLNRRLRNLHAEFTSENVVQLEGLGLEYPRGFVARDADGHALRFLGR